MEPAGACLLSKKVCTKTSMEQLDWKLHGRKRQTFDPVQYLKDQRGKRQRFSFKIPADSSTDSKANKVTPKVIKPKTEILQ